MAIFRSLEDSVVCYVCKAEVNVEEGHHRCEDLSVDYVGLVEKGRDRMKPWADNLKYDNKKALNAKCPRSGDKENG